LRDTETISPGKQGATGEYTREYRCSSPYVMKNRITRNRTTDGDDEERRARQRDQQQSSKARHEHSDVERGLCTVSFAPSMNDYRGGALWSVALTSLVRFNPRRAADDEQDPSEDPVRHRLC
jgi:hypothetical protein